MKPRDDVIVPDAWDEGEETADEVWMTANEESTAGEEEADSLPELVSGSEDSGYEFLNTRQTTRRTSRPQQQKTNPVTVIKETLAITKTKKNSLRSQ